MKFEMTKCNQCGSEMLMGLDTCPSCGKQQSRRWGAGSLQPRVMVAAALTAAVLFAFNWFKQPTPHATQVTSPPSVSVPSR